MLVLTRRIGEVIVINEDIRVTVVSINGNRVRLGISAPESVSVDREEIHRRRYGLPVPDHQFEVATAEV
jgi:carbon storage regulator